TISTSTFFDGLLVTGLYTSTSIQASQSIGGSSAFGFGIMSDHQFGNQFMCSVVASHVSHLPTTNLSFVWIAPPAGTGCVNFILHLDSELSDLECCIFREADRIQTVS
ncbi:Reelin, partial [Varanus komodoensis]